MYFIELPKLENAKDVPLHLANWVHFFTAKDEADLATLSEFNPAIREACEMLNAMSRDPKEREQCEARRKALLDYNSNMRGAREEGRKDLLLELAAVKFDTLPAWAKEQINNASQKQIQEWSQTIFTAATLEMWLA